MPAKRPAVMIRTSAVATRTWKAPTETSRHRTDRVTRQKARTTRVTLSMFPFPLPGHICPVSLGSQMTMVVP